MHTWIRMLLLACTCVVCCAQAPKRQFQFEQFPMKVFDGSFHMPTGVHKDAKGEWRDELEKWVAPPEVTFAGEYYLAGHSCGTGFRNYQLFKLRTGVDVPAVSMFSAGEPLPKTQDGYPYLTMLYYKPDSRLLIAEYHLDFDNPRKRETCRQRYYILEDDKLRPISKTFSFCTEGQEP